MIIGKFLSPKKVRKPSAMVLTSSLYSIFPDCFERNASAAFFGSPPITLQLSEKYFAANAVPAISPPPPTGVNI